VAPTVRYLGIVGSAVGIGAALSTTLAGYVDHFGSIAFWSAAVAVGLGLVWLLSPRPPDSARVPTLSLGSARDEEGLRRPRCWYANSFAKTVFRCLYPRQGGR
jgi:hypothetical protein